MHALQRTTEEANATEQMDVVFSKKHLCRCDEGIPMGAAWACRCGTEQYRAQKVFLRQKDTEATREATAGAMSKAPFMDSLCMPPLTGCGAPG